MTEDFLGEVVQELNPSGAGKWEGVSQLLKARGVFWADNKIIKLLETEIWQKWLRYRWGVELVDMWHPILILLLKLKKKTSPRGRTDSHRVISPLSLNEEENSLRKLGHGPGQMSKLPVHSRNKNWVRRRNGKSQRKAQSEIVGDPPSQTGQPEGLNEDHSHKRKETPEKQVPPKSYRCRGIKQLTVEPSGTDKEGAWPNISWLFWRRVPDPKPTGISTVLCGLLQFFTLRQKLLLMFLWAFFPRDQNGDDFFWFQILSFYSSCWHGRFHAWGRIEMVVNRW